MTGGEEGRGRVAAFSAVLVLTVKPLVSAGDFRASLSICNMGMTVVPVPRAGWGFATLMLTECLEQCFTQNKNSTGANLRRALSGALQIFLEG